MSRRSRHARRAPLRHAMTALVAGAATVAVLVALAVSTGVFDRLGSDEAGSPASATAPSSGGDPVGSTGQGSVDPTPVASAGLTLEEEREECRAAYRSAQEALDAAEASLEQWELHISAMNQLVSGEITLAQARDYWARTKVAATAKAEAFREAYREYRSTGGCEPPEKAGPGQASQLRRCAQALRADEKALAKAEVALTTWEHHITAMNRLAAGKLSGDRAAAMWQRMWQAGAAEMQEYTQAMKKARQGSCPLVREGPG